MKFFSTCCASGTPRGAPWHRYGPPAAIYPPPYYGPEPRYVPPRFYQPYEPPTYPPDDAEVIGGLIGAIIGGAIGHHHH